MKSAWAPQPGPQSEATAATWCNELFFGGARGGGKSDFLLGDFLQDVKKYGRHWQGILFRRTYPELQQIITRSMYLFPLTGATFASGSNEWTWPNGAVLRLRYLERVQDASRYQGHQYCVAVGTPILMADGTHKAIEEIRIGDLVATLEGAKKVTATITPYRAECVRAYAPNGTFQTHPVTHPILTDSGWQSYASLRDTYSKEFEKVCQESSRLPLVSVNARFYKPSLRSDILDPKSSQSHALGMSHGLFEGMRPKALKRSLRKLKNRRRASALQKRTRDCGAWLSLFDGGACAQRANQKAQGSRSDCLASARSCGGSLLDLTRTAQESTPLPVDVATPSRVDCTLDAPGSTRAHTRHGQQSYVHPYTGQVRGASEESFYGPCVLVPCGEQWVTDIQVEDANHYIASNTFLVNKNTWIGWDELTQWVDPTAYKMLTACLRWAEADVPTKRIRASGNPGGPGHQWVKSRFVDHAPLGFVPLRDDVTKMWRMFIPSRVEDNRILLDSDPGYVDRLRGTGSPELVRMWLEGDWNAVAGAYFPEFSTQLHVIEPFRIPEHWLKFRSIDWGSARPFSVGWYAVSSGDEVQYGTRKRIFPTGALIRYREWYGCSEPNVGLKLTAEQVADGIRSREMERLGYSVADPAMFQEDGGPSLAERFSNRGVQLSPADNKRLPGWDAVRARLIGHDDKPMIYFFKTCEHLIRTLPALQHDEKKPEDVDTDLEDHAGDDLRYSCMSRPYTRPVPKKHEPKRKPTFDEMLKMIPKAEKAIRY